MNHEKLSKIVFYVVTVVGICGFFLLAGMYAGYHKTSMFRVAETIVETVKSGLKDSEETSILRPDHLIQPARYPGSGITINAVGNNDGLILLSGFFGENSELRLIKRDGTLVNRWPLLFSEIFKDSSFLPAAPATNWNVDTHGALAMPDGSVVFNFDYSGTARIDRCGTVLWTLKRQSHHSVERAEKGGFWIPGQKWITDKDATRFPPFTPPFAETTLMRVSENGEVIREISVPKLFYDNGLESVLTSRVAYYAAKGEKSWNREIVHLNKVAELSSALAKDFPLFDAGDLLLSLRGLNLVLVVSPHTEKIKWWRIGPWLRQHDAEFKPGGTIVVFNNNIYMRTAFNTDQERTTKYTRLSVPRVSNILELNPVTDRHRVLYGMAPGEEMLSVTRGKVEITSENGLLITEFDGGRVFEVDAQRNITWQYVNRYNEDHVSEITEARLYPSSYFTVKDWRCPSTKANN